MSRGIDVEFLVQWAVARSGRLPWDRTRDRELAFDRGLTAKYRRRPPANWSLAAACAGIRIEGRAVPALMQPGPDVVRVIEAIKRLDGGVAEVVIACARAKRRPDWFEGIEPQRVARTIYPRRRNGRLAHRQVTLMVWSPCDPGKIRAARQVYAAWHAALGRLAGELDGRLDAWQVNGFRAPASPWLAARDTTY